MHALLQPLDMTLIIFKRRTDGVLQVVHHREVGKQGQHIFDSERASALCIRDEAHGCFHIARLLNDELGDLQPQPLPHLRFV